MTRKCKYCGAEFEPRRRDQRYCSHRCRNIWNVRSYQAKLRGDRPYRPRRPPAPVGAAFHRRPSPITRTCPVCGAVFAPNPSRPTQKFCSRACKKHDYSARHWQRQKAALEKTRPVRQRKRADSSPRPCELCGTVFTPPPKHPHARFCSRTCSNRATVRARMASRTTIKCEWCGKEVPRHISAQRFCSRRCRLNAKAHAARAKAEAAIRDSLARVRAYLALSPAERYARRGELTKAEHALAQKIYMENHSIRTVATNDLMH